MGRARKNAIAGSKRGRERPRVDPHVSFRMSQIRSQDTKIEVALRSALFREGLRFRKNFAAVLGRPDVVLVTPRIAIFCDSSFWHGRDLVALEKRLRTNKAFWLNKIRKNVARDRAVDSGLASQGWLVLRFWEEDLNKELRKCIAAVLKKAKSRTRTLR